MITEPWSLGDEWRGDGWREYCENFYAYVYRRARTQRFWGIVPSSRHPSPSFMACVSRHNILSCEFCQMNWDFDRAVTGSLSKLLGAKIMDFLHTPKCFAQFLYLRTHRLCLYVLFSTLGVGSGVSTHGVGSDVYLGRKRLPPWLLYSDITISFWRRL